MTGHSASLLNVQAVAAEVIHTLGTGRQVVPFSSRLPTFGLDDAYRVAAAVREMREARGETAVGRKIGFTNRMLWTQYGVYAPIWGYLYDRTVHGLAELGGTFSLAGLAEPRIEPEIMFGLRVAPIPGMDENALLGCIDWVAHGFEIVQSIFPNWKFSATDTIAGFGLHGALLIGPRHAMTTSPADWAPMLSSFEITLKHDSKLVDHGCARDVLDGPISALRHLNDLLASDRFNPPLAAGEIVTTGTLTRALPVGPGEMWTTEPKGVTLDGISVRFV